MSVARNRLAGETSPYLRQHAANPVDWYPWGPEALAAARERDKPIHLSVGYSACHWCHVMARESFTDPAVAALLNEHFINIKVDREERPELDHIYQTVCQLLTGSGGWPLTVFLTPEQRPFFAGTYFPPDRRYGRPSFREVLSALADAYREARSQVADQADKIVAALAATQACDGVPGKLGADILDRAGHILSRQFDRHHGGFGDAPKFPNPGHLELLLRHSARTGESEGRELVRLACRAMRAGGVYDQIGGGFHRYSVDAAWSIPHFEKMLYDNALLPPVYLAAWQATGDPALACAAKETLNYLLREMRAPAGGFYSATDADSEGEEGKFFVWTPDQVQAILDGRRAELVCLRFGIESPGNFEHGASVPCLAATIDELADSFGLSREAVMAEVEAGRQQLYEARARRVAPQRDEKLLAGWNGLALRAFARAALLLGRTDYLTVAVDCARFLLERLTDGRHLAHVYTAGQARLEGYLDDYAAVGLGLLELFGATGDPAWLTPALACGDTIQRDFADPAVGDFFMTSIEAEELLLRPKDTFDGATPSGLSLTAELFWRLGQLTGDGSWHAALERLLRVHADTLRSNAWGCVNLLGVLDNWLAEPETVVVAGTGLAADELVAAATRTYRPHRLVVRTPGGGPGLLAGREPVAGRPAAYLCRGGVCAPPITEPAELGDG